MNWGLITRADPTKAARVRKLGKVIGSAFGQVKPRANKSRGFLHHWLFFAGRYTPIAHSVPI